MILPAAGRPAAGPSSSPAVEATAQPGLLVRIEVQVAERRVDGSVGEVDPEQLAHVGQEAVALLRGEVGVLGDRVSGKEISRNKI